MVRVFICTYTCTYFRQQSEHEWTIVKCAGIWDNFHHTIHSCEVELYLMLQGLKPAAELAKLLCFDDKVTNLYFLF